MVNSLPVLMQPPFNEPLKMTEVGFFFVCVFISQESFTVRFEHTTLCHVSEIGTGEAEGLAQGR